MLLASVPLPVNSTCAGFTPTRAATAARASSTARRAVRPKAWTDDGLPTRSIAWTIAARTAGFSGVVALWSK